MKLRRQQNIAMFMLAIYPVIDFFYIPPMTFGYGTIIFIIFYIYSLFKYSVKNTIILPKFFIVFWLYIGIITFLMSTSFSPTLLLPGGSHAFCWVICLGFASKFYNVEYLRRYMRIIVFISAFLFCIQLALIYKTGSNMCFVPPLSSNVLYRDFSYNELVLFHLRAERPSALFMEPAYFAQYLLCLLTLELFGSSNIKYYNKYIILGIVVLLMLLRSGCGVIGLAFLILIKLASVYSTISLGKKIFYTIFLLPLFYFGIHSYTSSEAGSKMVDRKSEISLENTESSGSIRMLRGYVVYDNLPMSNKIFGSNGDDVKNIARRTVGYDEGMLFNGFQAYLVEYGIIGILLLTLIYSYIYRHGKIVTKASIIVLLVISFMEYTFFTPLMLILSVIAFGSQFNKNVYIKI